MTLHEIEETLHTLKDRHAGLDEQQLLVLLRAGGWEEKSIQEAITLFRSSGKTDGKEETREALPQLQERPLFVPPVDTDHLLSEGKEEEKEPEIPSPESIVVADPRNASKRDELPHNLPLRPFETSEHIWPFSRYRDVFYGEGEQSTAVVQHPEKVPVSSVVPPRQEQRAFVQTEPVMTPSAPTEEAKLPPPQIVQVHVVKAPLSKGDEKLVIMASVMLIIILLLLGYMYGNGRL